MLSLNDEYQVKTLGEFYDIVNFHTDARLGPDGHAAQQGYEYSKQFLHTLPILFLLAGLEGLGLLLVHLFLGLFFLILNGL